METRHKLSLHRSRLEINNIIVCRNKLCILVICCCKTGEKCCRCHKRVFCVAAWDEETLRLRRQGDARMDGGRARNVNTQTLFDSADKFTGWSKKVNKIFHSFVEYWPNCITEFFNFYTKCLVVDSPFHLYLDSMLWLVFEYQQHRCGARDRWSLHWL